MGTGSTPPPAAAGAPKEAPAAESDELPIDPVCGMVVPPQDAKPAGRVSVHKGKTHYFCADMCKQRFDANPAAFLAKPGKGGMEAGQEGHWEHDKDGRGPPHAAFALYVEAATAGVPVVAAGRLPPVDLPLREDLRTRLGSGPVFALQPLSDDDTAAVLRREAARRGIALADEVLAYLLTRYARDLGSLMGLLDALDAFSLAEKRAVTVPLLKKMLAEQAAHDLPA